MRYLAHAGGGCRLAVGVREHRHVLPLLRHDRQWLQHVGLERRQVQLRNKVLHGEWDGGVVDVLIGNSESVKRT